MNLRRLLDLVNDESCVPEGGAPAKILLLDGMPSYEDTSRKLLVYELMVVILHADRQVRMFPRRYPQICEETPDGLISFGGPSRWRPLVYTDSLENGWTREGSQEELAWRHNISSVESLTALPVAVNRAATLLRESLSPQQLIELMARHNFRVRGGRTGNLYEIGVGDGFRLLDHLTSQTMVTYCLHPESWMPADDVALATKLALEDPELEIACLENAQMGKIYRTRRATRADRYASDIERELIT